MNSWKIEIIKLSGWVCVRASGCDKEKYIKQQVD